MNKKIVVGCGVFFIILVISVAGFWIYLTHLGQWYDQVWAEMPSIDDKLIALNHAALAQIPKPAGAIVTDQKEAGVDTHYSYGVGTIVDYTIIDPKLDVQLYYRTLMAQLGWVLVSSDDSIPEYRYMKKTTCLEVFTFPPENKYYFIDVYQDFIKQDFSPKLPPDWYLVLRQGGENFIDHCP